MQIDVSSLIKGDSMTFSANETLHLPKEYVILEYSVPVEINGTISNENDVFLLTAYVKANLQSCCDKCLVPVPLAFDLIFSERFADSSVEDDISPLLDFRIDTKEVALAAILSNFPMKLLCNESCRGICPICSINRNEENCNCEKGYINPQFAALQSFFTDKEV